MIDLETLTRIRQLYYGEHWRVGTIAAELGLHHETVEGALKDETRVRPPEPVVALVWPFPARPPDQRTRMRRL